MKHPKKLTVEMKKLLSKNGRDPNMYWIIKNTSTEYVFIHKNDNSIVKINKKSGEVIYE